MVNKDLYIAKRINSNREKDIYWRIRSTVVGLRVLFSAQNGSEILTKGRDGGVHAGLRLVALRDRGADLSVRRSGRPAAMATGVVRVRALAATTPLQRRHPSAVDARPAAVGRRGHPRRQFDRQQDHREYASWSWTSSVKVIWTRPEGHCRESPPYCIIGLQNWPFAPCLATFHKILDPPFSATYTHSFFRHKAMRKRGLCCRSVSACLSVCPSRWWIVFVSTRLKISSNFLFDPVAPSF